MRRFGESMTHLLTIELGAPVASSDPYIHLDSFLSFAAGVESIGRDGLRELEDGGEPSYFEDEMPLDKYEHDGEWVWAASSAGIALQESPEDATEPQRWSATAWRSHFDHDPEHQIKETHINTSSGEFKSYNAALPYAAADTLTFFFEGDADRVVELIEKHVPGVGKKRSQGFGRIRNVSSKDIGNAVETAIFHNGRVLRAIPTAFAPTVQHGVTYERRTVRPPYWHHANQCMAIKPFTDFPRDAMVVLS